MLTPPRTPLVILLLITMSSPAVATGIARGASPLDDVAVLRMAPVDNAALLAEDARNAGPGIPVRFALPLPVHVTPDSEGSWEPLAGDRMLWRLRVRSPDAVSLNLGFSRYFLPAGGSLILYSPDHKHLRGPFTDHDNEIHGELWTPIVPGDEVVIEIQLPAARWHELELVLSAVNHGYREFGRAAKSGACNVDVVCPEGDGWRDEIRSVAVISTGGSTFCTGFMVNNTALDLAPYFMTAAHCGITSGNAASLVVYWNYENSTCRPPGSAESGGPGDGSLTQYQTGSYFRAAYGPSDFTLVELDDSVNPAFNVHWAGWDATGADASSAVAIHHPGTDEKRISFENDPTTTTSYGGTAVPGDGTHVRVTDWDLGTTEPGSSGSPLFNQDHRIIGQLHGGGAACGNDLSDWYGGMATSWTGGGTAVTRLYDWLDPTASGTLVLDGLDMSPGPLPGECPPGMTPKQLLADDLEAGAAGWTHFGSGDTWALSGVRTHSGAQAFHAAGVATISDQYLVTPAVALPSGEAPLTLQFWNYQRIEDSASGCYDGGVVAITTDGGSNWTRLEAELLTDPYDGAISTCCSNPLGGQNAWCGDPQDWVQSIVDLDAFAGQQVRFRFRLATDSSVSREGWYVDDLVVQSCTTWIFSDGFESGDTSAWSGVLP